jgi:hypothetical protein
MPQARDTSMDPRERGRDAAPRRPGGRRSKKEHPHIRDCEAADAPPVPGETVLEETVAFLGDQIQDREERRRFAPRIYWATIAWLVAVLATIVLEGFGVGGFQLPDAVLIALITSTTLNVISVLVTVVRYLFPRR